MARSNDTDWVLLQDGACWDSAEFAFVTEEDDVDYDRNCEQAKRYCRACPAPVLAECRRHGLLHETQGVWGGLDSKERRSIKRRRRGS